MLVGIVTATNMGCEPSALTAAEIGIDSIVIKNYHFPVLIGKDHNPVFQIRIDVGNPEKPLSLTGLSIASLGTSDLNDLQSVSVFKADTTWSFNNQSQFGTAKQPLEKMDFEGNADLAQGSNYFWVSCRLKPSASLLNKVQLSCASILIDGQALDPDSETSLADRQRIGHALRKSGDDRVNTYRIPGLATTNKGTLIGVYDMRRNGSVDLQEDIDIGVSRSTDGGQSWEPMKVIMDMGEWRGRPQIENGIGDPSILVDRQTNTVWVAGIWAHGHPGERNWFASGQGMKPSETSQFILVKSEDDGVSWSDPINITKQIKDPRWHLLLAGPGKGISLSNGTLVFPAQYKDENEVPHATIIYSNDGGTSWQIGSGVRRETTEAQIIELNDGSIMINARNDEARNQKGVGRVVATSNDLGKSWKEHPSSIIALEESTCMASLIYEPFEGIGKVLLFSNPNTHTGRFNITIKSSLDEGASWPDENWLLIDEGKSFGYSCMTRVNEETVGILYEGSQAHMVFEKVAIKELLNQH